MPYTLRRYILSRSEDVITTTEQVRFVTAACNGCGAVVRVEFDPPDDPAVRGRIDVLVEPRTASGPAPPDGD